MFVLQKSPQPGLIEYMSLDPNFAMGPYGAWVTDKSKAFGFARQSDAQQFQKKFSVWFDNSVSVGQV